VSQSLGFWPLLLFVGGTFWQVLKVSPGLVAGEKARSILFLGFLLLLGGISILELSARYPYFERTLTGHSFGGVVYLGIPYLLYDSLYRQRGYTHVSPQRLLALFALGMLSAIPCLVVGRVFFAPLIWLVAILVVAWVHEPWDDPWDGVVYALAPALGFAVFYTQPILIPLPYFAPFLGLFKAAQERYVTRTVWPWQAPWWRIFAGASLAAAILGYWLTRAHPARGRARPLRIIFGLILSLGFLAAWEFALLRAL
jgi:RsiW-degrading membrane proteinase PrsW (M82 family)